MKHQALSSGGMTNDITFCSYPRGEELCKTCMRNREYNKPAKEYISITYFKNRLLECEYYLGLKEKEIKC